MIFIFIGVDIGFENDIGDVDIKIKGMWVDMIFYEILLLVLILEVYFRFMDIDWNYDG